VSPTEATVRSETTGDRVVIVLSGEIDLDNADVVEAEVVAAIPNSVLGVTIDVNDITYIDSVGMRLLFQLATRLQTAQIEMSVVARPESRARRVIELSGLGSVIDVRASTP
jgi:anti-anti-sigma factor